LCSDSDRDWWGKKERKKETPALATSHTQSWITCQQWRTQDFFFEGGGSTNSVEDRGEREQGSGGSSPLVRGSKGSCNLVQEI